MSYVQILIKDQNSYRASYMFNVDALAGSIKILGLLGYVLIQNTILKAVKGTVQPQMKISSLFTNPQVVPNHYEFLFSVEHKRRYFKECWKPDS